MGKYKTIFALILIVAVVTVSGILPNLHVADADSLLLQHPDEAEDMRHCMECHDADDETFPFHRYDHTRQFTEHHGQAAGQGARVCRMCHSNRFCMDCHGVGNRLKPSLKLHGRPERVAPHRGNYLSRHQIEGRLNPASCFRCHGRPKNQRSCRACHG